MLLFGGSVVSARSNRAERIAINKGNKMAKDGKLAEAVKLYREALNANPQSDVARFNLGLTQINLSKAVQNNDSVSQRLLA
ncbi:MAG: tetratricopeptide repeat protein, partial [Muribaculaceae bacterium]|nr:tetratricopeptide repeat protein [Muribaculaceae bacterium]